jgi:hypothetical protein
LRRHGVELAACPSAGKTPLDRQFTPDCLLDHVEGVSEFTEFEETAVLETQKVGQPEAQGTVGGTLPEADIRHDGGAVAFYDDDLAVVILQRELLGDARSKSRRS